jgi:hypothetical protein
VISFRYHIVSIVSVFLALAVGVALGGGPLKGTVDNTLVQQVHADRQTKRDLTAEVAALRTDNRFNDDFASTVAPRLLRGDLRGRVVTIVALPSADPDAVSSLQHLVGVAGGTVGGTMRIGRKMVDVSGKQLVDELGNQLESRTSGLDIPADAAPYERMGALVARAIGTDSKGGAPVDNAATSILAGLSTTNLMSAQGRLARRGDLVLFVDGDDVGDPSARQSTSTIIASLVQAVDAGTAGVVLAGPVESAKKGGAIKTVRDDVGAAKDVSTVDTLHRTAGQVVAVMALAGQAAGRTGHYGAIDAANGAMPGASAGTS